MIVMKGLQKRVSALGSYEIDARCECSPAGGGYARARGLVSCRAVSCRAVSCRAVPCRAVPCRAVPCHAVSCRDAARRPRSSNASSPSLGARSLGAGLVALTRRMPSRHMPYRAVKEMMQVAGGGHLCGYSWGEHDENLLRGEVLFINRRPRRTLEWCRGSRRAFGRRWRLDGLGFTRLERVNGRERGLLDQRARLAALVAAAALKHRGGPGGGTLASCSCATRTVLWPSWGIGETSAKRAGWRSSADECREARGGPRSADTGCRRPGAHCSSAS